MPGWRNWQTRYIQVVVSSARAGSSPVPGTDFKNKTLTSVLFLFYPYYYYTYTYEIHTNNLIYLKTQTNTRLTIPHYNIYEQLR